MLPRILAASCALLVVAACSDSTEPRVPTTLELDRATLQLTVNESRTVAARIVDQNGNAFQQIPEGFEVQWSVDAGDVVQVDQGSVLGLAVGSAIVTAQAGGLPPAQVMVEVSPDILDLSTEFRMDYAGAESGRFDIEAEFEFRLQDGPQGDEWAFAFYDLGFGSQDLVAERTRDDGRFDLFWVWAEGEPITMAETVEVSDGYMIFGVSDTWLDVTDFSTWEGIYFVQEGAINFTHVTDDRMHGEFWFDLEASGEGTLAVTNGNFDMPSLQLGAVGAPAAVPGAELAGVRERLRNLAGR
jgi:hypothetical protein